MVNHGRPQRPTKLLLGVASTQVESFIQAKEARVADMIRIHGKYWGRGFGAVLDVTTFGADTDICIQWEGSEEGPEVVSFRETREDSCSVVLKDSAVTIGSFLKSFFSGAEKVMFHDGMENKVIDDVGLSDVTIGGGISALAFYSVGLHPAYLVYNPHDKQFQVHQSY